MEAQLATARLKFYPSSRVSIAGAEFGLAQTSQGNKLVVLAPPGSSQLLDFRGESSDFGKRSLLLCSLNPENAASLRKHVGWLRPQCLGLRTSAGMGDRMGIATPGHVRAIKETNGKVAPIFAQQSIREMQRTGRAAQQVMDDATWGIFQEGWQAGVGADADHLKTEQDIDECVAAGFTQFTLDPGQYVDDRVDNATSPEYLEQIDHLPQDMWPEATGLSGKVVDIDGYQATFSRPVLLKAILKYGRAINHILHLNTHLESVCSSRPFELEISMDETENPTSPEEHIYIASELGRHGVKWAGFAPRFVGSFEKGVEYIGDLGWLESELAVHAAIARQYGPYKLSLHSGSDKFSIYPLFMHSTQGLTHLKTAGTSYLEALRTLATVDVDLFKEIYIFARQHFEVDRKSYHISARLDVAPQPAEIHDWPALLEQFDARQVLHVTFGSVLTEKMSDGGWRFYDRVMARLQTYCELYYDNLVAHFRRHLAPFTSQ